MNCAKILKLRVVRHIDLYQIYGYRLYLRAAE